MGVPYEGHQVNISTCIYMFRPNREISIRPIHMSQEYLGLEVAFVAHFSLFLTNMGLCRRYLNLPVDSRYAMLCSRFNQKKIKKKKSKKLDCALDLLSPRQSEDHYST